MPIDERINLESEDLDVAIVMAADPKLLALGVRILQRVLPDYLGIIKAGSCEAVLSRISERVALVMAFDDSDNQARNLASSLFINNGEGGNPRSKVPLFLVTDPASMDGETETLENFGFVDSLVPLPLSAPQVLQIVNRAMAKRRGLLMELEGAAKVEALKEFVDYYLNLSRIWLANISRVSLAPKPGEAVVEGTPAEDIYYLLQGIEDVIGILTRLGAENFAEISNEALSKYFHDLNNSLSSVFAYPEFVLKAPGLTPEDLGILTMLTAEAHQLNSHSTQISRAYHGAIFWQDLNRSKLILQSREKLEIPPGTSFCVIDDDQGILRVVQKTIEAAGGFSVLVDSREALEKLFAASETGESLPEIKIFLLDNDLGNGIFGHQLIPLIRSKYPHALIIAHTSEDLSLNSDPNNEYKKAGIEIVGKRRWGAVSGVVRRKMRKSDGETV